MANISKIKLPSGNTYDIKDEVSGYTTNTGTVTSVRVQATSPIVSSQNTEQTTTLNTTISHATSGVTAGTYGTSTKVPVVTINDTGHVTSVTNTDITVGGYQTISNISVSGTPTAVVAYELWDTNQEYGYYLDVSVSGITTDTRIFNFITDISLLNSIAPYVETNNNSLRLFFTSSDSVSSTIYTLVIQG